MAFDFAFVFLSVCIFLLASYCRAINDTCGLVRAGQYPSGQKQSIPKNLEKSGTFFLVKNSQGNLTACIDACCQSKKCHVAYFHGAQKTCYAIQCHSYELCQPTKSESKKHAESVFVWVREESLKNAEESEFADYGEPCGEEEDEKLCRSGLSCWWNKDKSQKKCFCGAGEHVNKDGECEDTAPKGPRTQKNPKECEMGMNQCPGNEICGIQNAHSKKGICRCLKGMVRDETGTCVLKSEGTSNAPTTTQQPGGGGKAPEAKKPVAVEITGPDTVQLPKDSAQLHAAVDKNVNDEFVYAWTAVSNDESKGDYEGDGLDSPNLKLSKLHPGKKTFRVKITGKQYEGTAEHTLTILEEKKVFDPPVAVIYPPSVTEPEGSQIVLDARKSEDKEGKGLSYTWTQKKGPQALDLSSKNAAELTLTSLKPGVYTFGLTVTSKSGLTDTAEVNVTVKKERDDPPEAVVGECSAKPGDFTVTLPQEQIFICGNKSHDDKKIVSWTWTKVDPPGEDVLPADLTGTSSPVLTVSKIKPGTYNFELKVADEKKQTDQKTIRLHVNPAKNKPPVAIAGPNLTVVLPKSDVILDGSRSTDDHEITKFIWTKISGPGEVQIANQDKAKATVSGLTEGTYRFRLNVSDQQGLWDHAHTFVLVNRSKNTPPVASADDLRVDLPKNYVVLDGSKSYDDFGIVSWKWELMENSSAIVTILGDTMEKSALNLTNLIAGAYSFNFTVFDEGKLGSWKVVQLVVNTSKELNESVEIYLNLSPKAFSGGVKNRLRLRLSTLLHSGMTEADSVEVVLTEVGVDRSTGRVRIVFYCSYKEKGGEKRILEGTRAVGLINAHIDTLGDFSIEQVDTLFCRNPCSGHGVCDDFTKECKCESYWMPNLFTYYILRRRGNCNWSVLYFVIVLILLLSTVAGTLWAMICAGKRICPGPVTKPVTRRRKYRMMNEKNFRKPAGKNGIQLSSLLVSDSNVSDSDEEDTVYDRTAVNRESSTSSLLKNGAKKVKA